MLCVFAVVIDIVIDVASTAFAAAIVVVSDVVVTVTFSSVVVVSVSVVGANVVSVSVVVVATSVVGLVLVVRPLDLAPESLYFVEEGLIGAFGGMDHRGVLERAFFI